MAFPDSWGPYFFLSITKAAGSAIEFASIIDLSTLEINEGEHPTEFMPNAAGGYTRKEVPQEVHEISFEIWARELDTATGVGLFQQFFGSTDAAEPLKTTTAINASVQQTRDRFRLAILWTNDPAATAAASSTASSTDSLRYVLEHAVMVTHQPTMTDGILKIPVTFRAAPHNRAGTARNAFWESGDQTALPALGSFT